MLKTGRRKSVYRKSEYRRLGKKTREHRFIETLEREFELSPRESMGVMEVARDILLERSDKKEGQVQYTCVRKEEGAGKKMEEMRKVDVLLTPIVGSDYRVK